MTDVLTSFRRRRRFLACAAGLTFGVLLHGQPQIDTAIINTTVLTMVSGRMLLREHSVLISGSRIVDVVPTKNARVPEGARRIDATGRFVIPGLADMHVHLEYFDDPGILGLFLANGVTTVRNMDGRPYILEWRQKSHTGAIVGPRIYTAGPLLDGSPPVRPDNTSVADAVAARTEVEAQAGAGYDFIKAYSALSSDAFDAIVHTAHARRLSVAGHVPRAVGIQRALSAGLKSIEHLADYASVIEADASPFKDKPHWSKRYLSAPIDPARLKAIVDLQAQAGAWTVPTLIQPLRELLTDEEIARRLQAEEVHYIPPDGRRQWEQMARRFSARLDEEDWKLIRHASDNRLQVAAALRAGGVPILVGTDTPNPFVVPGFSIHDELELFVRAGFTPAEALTAATREAARFMGVSDWGTIEAGLSADLVLLEGNPLDDITATRRIAGVMRAGRWWSSTGRQELLDGLRKGAQR